MNSRKTCLATLLAAARYAKELASYLISQPFDFTALNPLADAARTIRDCAQALRNRELWRLGERLYGAAQMDLSTPDGVTELDSTVSRIVSAVERLAVAEKTKRTAATTQAQSDTDDPFSLTSSTRWVIV